MKTIDRDSVMLDIKNAVEAFNETANHPIEIVNNNNNNDTIENANISIDIEGSESIFSAFEDPEQNTVSSVSSEIDAYVNSKPGKITNVLKFWMNNKNTYPNLFRYFMSFAAIQASSAAAERLFSLCHNIITVKRNRLDGDVIDMIAFLNKNKKWLIYWFITSSANIILILKM